MIVQTIKFKDQILVEGSYEVSWAQINSSVIYKTGKNGIINISYHSNETPDIILIYRSSNPKEHNSIFVGNYVPEYDMSPNYKVLWESEETLTKRIMFNILGRKKGGSFGQS